MEKIKLIFGLYFLFLLLSAGLGVGTYFIYPVIARYVFGVCVILSVLIVTAIIYSEVKT
jgi:hypothetical protein